MICEGTGHDLRLFAAAVAEDAEALAILHDRELTAEVIGALREAAFPGGLGLAPIRESAKAAWLAMSEAVVGLPADACLDELHAEFAAVYLIGAAGASPCESAWTDDDGLVCQDSMFELRRIYADAGLAVANWRKRADDHLVLQLLYVARAARRAQTADDWRRLGAMLDQHLLFWLPDFASRVAMRSGSPFYSALAILTVEWLEVLRSSIVAISGAARGKRQAVENAAASPAGCAQSPAYVPGVAPSW